MCILYDCCLFHVNFRLVVSVTAQEIQTLRINEIKAVYEYLVKVFWPSLSESWDPFEINEQERINA